MDFRDYLWNIEDSVEAFRHLPIVDWPKGSPCWVGFFKALRKLRPELSWAYVPNPSGGFWAAWRHKTGWEGQTVYLQIEERRLCFKVAAEDGADKRQVRDDWMKLLLGEAADAPAIQVLRPARLGHGIWMTVGVSEQNEWMKTNRDGLLDIEGTLGRLLVAEALISASVARSGL